MTKVSVVEAVDKDVPLLTSRSSARKIKAALDLENQIHFPDNSLSLDFSGAEGVAPSFLDEALLVAEEYIVECGQPDAAIIFGQPPTTLAAKHHAIARAHGRTLVVNDAGDWEFRKI